MRKLSVWLVATVISTISLVGFAAPAQAQTCPIERFLTTGSCW